MALANLPYSVPEFAGNIIYRQYDPEFVQSAGGKAAISQSLLDCCSLYLCLFGTNYGNNDYVTTPRFNKVFFPEDYPKRNVSDSEGGEKKHFHHENINSIINKINIIIDDIF